MLEYILLGIVQGLTEWLPVSSSGHLVIFEQLFNIQVDLFFNIILHFGTLIVLLLFFWKDIFKLSRKWILYIGVGSLITGLIGFLFYDVLKSLFSSLFAVGLGLMFTSLVLFSTKRYNGNSKIGIIDSIFIGLAQAIAIIPGVSRSGMTISTGLFRNVKKEEVFKFSFLLSMPAVLGALIYEGSRTGFNFNVNHLIGFIVSVVIGYLSLNFLRDIVKKRKLHYFGYYCLVVGAIVFFVSII
jgi:undecaprenyl-diphosphatase